MPPTTASRPADGGRRLPLWVVKALWCVGIIGLLIESWPHATKIGGKVFLISLSLVGAAACVTQGERGNTENDEPEFAESDRLQ